MEAPVAAAEDVPLFAYRGRLAPLFRIHLVNILLTVLTLGIYRFWAKTRMRRYLWRSVEVAGDALEYTGRGGELFLGFLVIFFLIIVPLFVLPSTILSLFLPEAIGLQSAVGIIQTIAVLVLIPAAVYRARRYRLTRTRWRGLRGGQSGSALAYAGKSLLYSAIELFTLGLTAPIFRTRLAAYRLGNTWIGAVPLSFAGRSRPLYPAFFAAIAAAVIAALLVPGIGIGLLAASIGALSPESIGVAAAGNVALLIVLVAAFIGALTAAAAWYQATEIVHFTRATRFEGLGFDAGLGRWPYVWLAATNTLIVLLSVGVLAPWAYHRYLTFFARRFRVVGAIESVAVRQSTLEAPSRGEGLLDALDLGGI